MRASVDSIFWHTGFRPDTVAVSDEVMLPGMPAGSFGQALASSVVGSVSPAIPTGVVKRAAQEAWRNAGQDAGADTVLETIGRLDGVVRNQDGIRACSVGPTRITIDPQLLRQQDGAASPMA